MRWPLLLSLLLVLVACGDERSAPGGGGDGGDFPPDISAIIYGIAVTVGGIGAVALAAAVFVGIFVSRKRGAQLGLAGGSLLIGSQLLVFVGVHLVLVSVLVVAVGLLGAGWWAWRTGAAEPILGRDLNGDGRIGPPDPESPLERLATADRLR